MCVRVCVYIFMSYLLNDFLKFHYKHEYKIFIDDQIAEVSQLNCFKMKSSQD